MIIICDIDGTICDWKPRASNHENPGRQDLDKYKAYVAKLMKPGDLIKDKPIEAIREILKGLRQSTRHFVIVYLTGRSEIHRDETQAWLGEHGFPNGNLIMRGAEDWRSAVDFKRDEIKNIKIPHKPILALEDEPEVAKMMVEEGVTVLQVHYK
jgi:hypothetical protein